MKPVHARFGMSGHVKVEAFDRRRDQRPVWSWESRNLITNQGLSLLHATTILSATNWLIMGTSDEPAEATDSDTPFTPAPGDPLTKGYYETTVPVGGLWCALPATDQPGRFLRCGSSEDGGNAHTSELVSSTYWRRQFTRVIHYGIPHYQYARGNPAVLEWDSSGRTFPLLEKEAQDPLRELSFAYAYGLHKFELCHPAIKRVTDLMCGQIFNRIVLPESLAFFGDGAPAEAADVILSNDGEIRVTFELRVYPPIAPIVTELEIDGVPTTIRTRAYRLDDRDRWGQSTSVVGGGWLARFGDWTVGSGGAGPGVVGESNAMPALTADIGGSKEVLAARTVLATSDDPGAYWKDCRYVVPSNLGNFAGGIGSIHSGRWATGSSQRQTLIHTFDPPIMKGDERKLHFDIRYQWGAV